MTIIIIKKVLFILILIYAGIYDYEKRIIPDKVHVIIIVLALLSSFNPIQSILGLLILPIPFILPIFLDDNSVGGGDIKLAGSIGFYLGLKKGILAMLVALSLSAIMSVVLKKHSKELIPLGPYMAIGSIISLLF